MFRALLITLPEGFVHRVMTPTQILNVNKAFPLAAGTSWADASQAATIKIKFDDTNEKTVIHV
jgi:hypothetical protein